MRLLASFFILFFIVSCKQQKPTNNLLGVVNITITGKESAQPHFEKGLLLLHSFEYEDAREAFQMAQKEDPKMANGILGRGNDL